MQPGQNLFDDIETILGRAPELILDIGAQQGQTTIAYLDRFSACKVYAFEPETENWCRAQQHLAPYSDRVELLQKAIGDVSGEVVLNVNSHDGTHSLLESGDQRYWDDLTRTLRQVSAPCIRLDDFFAERRLESADLVAMDIQGAELRALRGADRLLREQRIKLIYCEVEFYSLYKGQPLFWDIGAYLQQLGYHFYALYNPHYDRKNSRVLSWADALFVSRLLLDVPEHESVSVAATSSL